MKKLLVYMLCLMCLISVSGLAENNKIIGRNGLDQFDDTVNAICSVGDIIWMLGENDRIYTYDASADAMREFAWDDEWTAYMNGVIKSDPPDRIVKKIEAWFSLEDSVCTLVSTISAENGIEDVGVYKIVLNGDIASMERIADVDWKSISCDGYIELTGCCMAGNTLCILANIGCNALYFIDLEDSKTICTDIEAEMICPYNEELLVMQIGEERSAEISVIDPDTLNVQNRASFDCGENLPGGIIQNPNDGRLFMSHNGYLLAFDLDAGETERIASIPIDLNNFSIGACACVLPSGIYAAGTYDGVILRDLTNCSEDEFHLTISDQCDTEAVKSATLSFNGVSQIVVTTRDHILDQLLTRSEDVDIYVLSSMDDPEQALEAILERGWAADIQSEILQSYVSSMYPDISQRFVHDGALVAIPIKADSVGMGINIGALAELGLSYDDVPTNWVDFLRFIQSLAGNGIVPVLEGGSREQVCEDLLWRVLGDYQLEIENGVQGQLAFAELSKVFDTLLEIDFEGIIESDKQVDTYDGNPLITSYCGSEIGGYTYLKSHDYYPLRLSISERCNVYLPLQCCVAVINPYSKNKDEAVSFLERVIEYVDPASHAMLIPTWGEALHDGNYLEAMERIKDRIASIEKQLAGTGKDNEALMSELRWAEEDLANIENGYWLISPQSLEWYREHDEHVVLATTGILGKINLPDLVNRKQLSEATAELSRQFIMRYSEGF